MKQLVYLLVSLSAICAGPVRAEQKKDLMKADYLYRHLAYHEAIPYYEKAAVTTTSPDLYMRLGDCYRLVKAPAEAAGWYAKAVAIPGCPAQAKLSYAQMLMMLGRYDDAIVWLEQYQASAPEDVRVANLVKGCREARQMKSAMPDGNVTFLAFNTDGSEFGPALRKGQLVFTADTGVSQASRRTDNWTGTPYYNILSVSCSHDGQCASDIRRAATNINTKFHDGPAAFSADGSTMYFTRTNVAERFLSRGSVPGQDGVVRLQILVATGYSEATGQYAKIQDFPFNSKQYSTAHPTISPSGKTLVFASDMPGGTGGTDLYICMKDDRGNWSAPKNMGKVINTEGDEMFPFLYDDKTIYFSSDGHVGMGGLDIYKVIWSESDKDYTVPENLGLPVNSSYDDMSLTLVPGGAAGYFSSNRPATRKGDNIYFVNLKRMYLSLKLRDRETNEPVYAATANLRDGRSDMSFTSDAGGHVFARINPQGRYTVEINRAGYKPQTFEIPAGLKADTLYRDLTLDPDFGIRYQVVVIDESSRRPISDPMLVFSTLGGSKPDTSILTAGRSFSTELKPDTKYHVYALKDKYYGNEKVISTAGISRSSGQTVLYDTLFMKELKIGQVYEIENIYYDYDKADIRADARSSLNRLLELLQQYPEMQIQINSHTDCRGSDSYNLNLSRQRAESVVRYLQQRGIARPRLSFRGFGESMPVEPCASCETCTEQQHQKNRRTEFQITAM